MGNEWHTQVGKFENCLQMCVGKPHSKEKSPGTGNVREWLQIQKEQEGVDLEPSISKWRSLSDRALTLGEGHSQLMMVPQGGSLRNKYLKLALLTLR